MPAAGCISQPYWKASKMLRLKLGDSVMFRAHTRIFVIDFERRFSSNSSSRYCGVALNVPYKGCQSPERGLNSV